MDQNTNRPRRHPALNYHEFPKPGKLEVRPTKPLANPRDLSLAYSPGVAEACLAIKESPIDASRYTARGNLVAVVSNGSAALGLGNHDTGCFGGDYRGEPQICTGRKTSASARSQAACQCAAVQAHKRHQPPLIGAMR